MRIKWLCPVYDGEGDAEGGNCAMAAYTEILRALCLLYGVSADYILDLPEGLKRLR